MKKGFQIDFIGYISTTLSILIGLFITSIIYINDKYKPCKIKNNATINVWNTQEYNYTKKFTYITGYNTIISIFCLILLSLNVLFKKRYCIDIENYYFCFKNLNWCTIKTFICVSIIIVQRFLILYWLASIVYNTLYIVSSMINYTIVKMEREDIIDNAN